MSDHPSRPPYDPAFDQALAAIAEMMPPGLTADHIPMLREPGPSDIDDATIAAHGLVRRDLTIDGYEGAPIAVSVINRADHAAAGPGILYTHASGMVGGNRLSGLGPMLRWAADHDAVLVTVEYRLAPEFPDPYPVEDCYAALVWMSGHGDELAVDIGRLLIAGSSAGGGVAAGTALLARDRTGPTIIGQVLMSPMLDDRDRTTSTQQYDGIGVWDRASNRMGWTALLGDRRGGDDVSIYAAPARADDLRGLPPTYIDCGSAEVFRDEDVAYATALWAAGVPTELHIWSGGFHGFDVVVPDAAVSIAAVETRRDWIARHLGARIPA